MPYSWHFLRFNLKIIDMLTFFIVIICGMLFINFKKMFVIYMAFSVWLACFFSNSQNLLNTMSLCSLAIFVVRGRNMIPNHIWKRYPLLIFSILYFSSLLLSNYFTGNVHNSAFINKILVQITNVFILWCIFETYPHRYIALFFKASIIFAILLCTYAIYEIISRTNPLVVTFADLGLYNSSWYSTEIRFGLKRAQSFLMMHTSLGGVCIALFSMLFVALKFRKLNNLKVKVLLLLLFFVAFATGSRSAILAIAISLCLYFSEINTKQLGGLVIVAGIFLIFQSYFDTIISSFQDTEAVQGSNSDMREGQFDIAFASLLNHFWLGNGLTYTFSDSFFTKELFGAESLWLPIIIEQGVWGCITVAIFFIQCFVYCLKQNKKYLCFFVLAMLVLFSMTSVPQFNFTYVFIYLYVMVNMDKLTVDKTINNGPAKKI